MGKCGAEEKEETEKEKRRERENVSLKILILISCKWMEQQTEGGQEPRANKAMAVMAVVMAKNECVVHIR